MLENLHHTAVQQQVTLYQQARVRRWKRILLSLTLLTSIVLGLTHLVLYVHWRKLSHTHRDTTAKHQALAQRWSTYQKTAKRLKLLKKEHPFKNAPLSCVQCLNLIAQALPDAALILSFIYKNSQFIVHGYADTHKELTDFLTNLSQAGFTQCTLTQSQLSAAGVCFEIGCTL